MAPTTIKTPSGCDNSITPISTECAEPFELKSAFYDELVKIEAFVPAGNFHSMWNDENIKKCFAWYNKHFREKEGKLPLTMNCRPCFMKVATEVKKWKAEDSMILHSDHMNELMAETPKNP